MILKIPWNTPEVLNEEFKKIKSKNEKDINRTSTVPLKRFLKLRRTS